MTEAVHEFFVGPRARPNYWLQIYHRSLREGGPWKLYDAFPASATSSVPEAAMRTVYALSLGGWEIRVTYLPGYVDPFEVVE